MTYINRSIPNHANGQSLARADLSPGLEAGYVNLDTRYDVQDRIFWCYLNAQGRPSFTQGVLADLHHVQCHISGLSKVSTSFNSAPVSWVVLASRTPGVFSLGGDLTLFATLIQSGDHEGLRRYAYSCVEIAHCNSTGYGGRAISIGLAQGEALGGGFESLLSCDVLVAERRARFGLPEVLMNLFPGMGAHCFLTRRVGPAAAVRMILSGEVFTAEAMQAMGIVDVLAENGKGEEAVQDYILKHQSRHRSHSATYEARRRISPVTLDDLKAVCDVWVETAMALTSADLRRMALLVSAQDRSRRRQVAAGSMATE